MTIDELATLAKDECCSEVTTAHAGGPGRPFWNQESFQFMYVPSFRFPGIPRCKSYRYIAKGSNEKIYSFESNNSYSLLTPIWAQLPEGVTELKVYSLDADGKENCLVGARTFFKLAPFPADLPPAVSTYSECAAKVFDYAMSQSFITHWLDFGTPDPDYSHYVYPSKMVAAIIDAMLSYAKVCPEKEATAIAVAKNAADYSIAHSIGDGSPLCGLPLTYQIDFRENPETQNNLAAGRLLHTVMMIYPARMATAYLNLEEKTNDKKYFDAALKIGEYYRNHVSENGSWHLVLSIETGEALSPNYCSPLRMIIPMLMKLYRRTGDESWKALADNAISYIEKNQLASYEWEGQFEDSRPSAAYTNLTHYDPNALARYYAEYFPDDTEKMACAADLVRFTEDQFIVWTNHAPWSKFDVTQFSTPAGLEQYFWHVPIDASTADFIDTFMTMHKATKNELYLAKARALADSITRLQHPSGLIPTHWMNDEYRNGKNVWLNCMFQTAKKMADLDDYIKTL